MSSSGIPTLQLATYNFGWIPGLGRNIVVWPKARMRGWGWVADVPPHAEREAKTASFYEVNGAGYIISIN